VIAGRHSGWSEYGRLSVSEYSEPSVLVPSDGVFGRFDLVALSGCHTLDVCLFVCYNCMHAGLHARLGLAYKSCCWVENSPINSRGAGGGSGPTRGQVS
jgi:hypothetical protein